MHVAGFAEALEKCATLDDARLLFRAAIAPHGFNASACGSFHVSRRGGATEFYFQDWPDEWIRIYQEGNFVNHDFGVAEARKRFTPFTWSEAYASRDLSVGEKRIWKAAQDYGWRDGFSVPLHGPGGYFGLVVLAGSLPAYPLSLRQELHLLAFHVHDRCRRLAGAGVAALADETLTSRELECFRWIAAGADDAAIAAHLKLSPHTVRAYVDEGRKKLNAGNRAQAVAMLLAAGLL